MFVFDDEVDEEGDDGYVECIWRRPLFVAIMKIKTTDCSFSFFIES